MAEYAVRRHASTSYIKKKKVTHSHPVYLKGTERLTKRKKIVIMTLQP